MRRRAFFGVIGVAAAWPLVGRAEQAGLRRVGVLMSSAENDPVAQVRFNFFVQQSLKSLGWTEGRTISIEVRWPGADLERIQKSAIELVALQCDVIVTTSTPTTAAVQRETAKIPIVFTNVSDPVGEGFVSSLASPGRNITGFINYEGSIAGKWVQLLKEIDPRVTRAAILFNPEMAPRGGSYFGDPFEAAAKSLGITPVAAPVRSDADIETAISAIGREPGGGLVVSSDSFIGIHRARFVECAARYRVPAVYPFRGAPVEGGLLSYGPDIAEFYRPLGPYVDRILKGKQANELPVQVPTKVELVINLRTAKTLGLDVPATLLGRADEVIE
jgi:putative tryptophan/tyrosine transport system substrate-binding protein